MNENSRSHPFVDEFGVDLRRPLYPQVASLGDRYFAWVHRPIRRSTIKQLASGDRGNWPGSIRIFEQDWLEAMTHIPWQLVLGIWIPIVAALAATARFTLGMPWGRLAGIWTVGLLAWTLAEYVLHRFGFHTIPRSAGGIKAHFLAHGIHHFDPYDPSRLLFPPLGGLAIASAIFLGSNLFLTLEVSLAMMSGFLTGYLLYDFSHYVSHHGKTRDPWFRYLHRYHQAHHHREPHAMYGVSSPLWDLVFRSGARQG